MNARRSPTSRSGCSIAGKWPPTVELGPVPDLARSGIEQRPDERLGAEDREADRGRTGLRPTPGRACSRTGRGRRTRRSG